MMKAMHAWQCRNIYVVKYSCERKVRSIWKQNPLKMECTRCLMISVTVCWLTELPDGVEVGWPYPCCIYKYLSEMPRRRCELCFCPRRRCELCLCPRRRCELCLYARIRCELCCVQGEDVSFVCMQVLDVSFVVSKEKV